MRLLLTLIIFLFPINAFAQQCGDTQGIHDHLQSAYEEQTIWIGIDNQGFALEIMHSVNNGTWTLLLNRPEGITCILKDGHGSIIFIPDNIIPEENL